MRGTDDVREDLEVSFESDPQTVSYDETDEWSYDSEADRAIDEYYDRKATSNQFVPSWQHEYEFTPVFEPPLHVSHDTHDLLPVKRNISFESEPLISEGYFSDMSSTCSNDRGDLEEMETQIDSKVFRSECQLVFSK